jgi:hypothetical protein
MNKAATVCCWAGLLFIATLLKSTPFTAPASSTYEVCVHGPVRPSRRRMGCNHRITCCCQSSRHRQSIP